MKFFGKNKPYGMQDLFSNTVSMVFRLMAVLLILFNYVTVEFGLKGYNLGNSLMFALSSFMCIVLLLFVEPGTCEKYPKINFMVNMAIGLCCGLIFISHRTYMTMSIFYIHMVHAGLRMKVVKSFLLAVFYYVIYMFSMSYGSQAGVDSILFDSQVLLIFFSIVYMCHFFSSIERRKNKQDEAVVELVGEKFKLAQGLENKNIELEQVYWDMVETLIGVIEARDNFTGGHSVKVCEYSVKLSKKLGLDKESIDDIAKASILHDIGKMGIPDNILLKPAALSKEEYNTIMSHPEIGCSILTNVKGLESILPMILYHHEKVDGTGYPYGLTGDKIPYGAKIIAIADAYDAMTSNRPYRKSLVKKEARKRLLQGAGTQFESELVERFLEIIDSDNVDDIRSYRHIDVIRKNTGKI